MSRFHPNISNMYWNILSKVIGSTKKTAGVYVTRGGIKYIRLLLRTYGHILLMDRESRSWFRAVVVFRNGLRSQKKLEEDTWITVMIQTGMTIRRTSLWTR